MKKVIGTIFSFILIINIFGVDIKAKEILVGSDNYLLFNYEDSILYKQLDDKGKMVYESLYEACIEFKPYYRYKGLYDESVSRALRAFSNDWPEFYWVDGYNVLGVQFNNFDIDCVYSYGIINDFSLDSKETYYEIMKRGKTIVKDLISDSEYTTVKNIYDYVVGNCNYILGAKYNQDLRSALLYGDTVCMGYAKLFQFLCKLAGIECYTTTGRYYYDLHAWNYVLVDGTYYWVDCTWGKEGNYRYFLIDDEARFTKIQSTDFDYPVVEHGYRGK